MEERSWMRGGKRNEEREREKSEKWEGRMRDFPRAQRGQRRFRVELKTAISPHLSTEAADGPTFFRREKRRVRAVVGPQSWP
jgi:hypothetical protein